MELIFNIITLIKEINDHINDYKCDDDIIDGVIRKICNIDPHLRGMTLNLEDPIINVNCQSLFRIITKIKKDIKDYQSSYKINKFRKIGELKRNIHNFDYELNNIFKNLKLNILIDNSKLINDLKTHIEGDVLVSKELLDMKRNSIKLKKESKNEINDISEKIKYLQESLLNTSNIKISDIMTIYDNIYEFDTKYNKFINDLNISIIKLENNLNSIKEKINVHKNLKIIIEKIETQDIKIKYHNSLKKYFYYFIIDKIFYYFFVIIFYGIYMMYNNEVRIYT